MAKIVVMEDDASTRMLVSAVLRKEGHDVWTADDGQQGLALLESRRPDLIVSDIQMPGMNGIEMLTALRQKPAYADIPVILLTSLQERAHMRVGMTSGADDYITKPFQPMELREAVSAQLNRSKVRAALKSLAVGRAVDEALTEQADRLVKLYELRLAKELSKRWPTAASPSTGDEHFDFATVLFADMHHHADLAQKLSADELSDLVRRFYLRASDATGLFGASHMQFVGEGLLAVFTDTTNTNTVNHALRAARTALALTDAVHAIRGYLDEKYAGRGLPPFEANVALNSGPVTVTHLQDPLHGGSQRLPVGDATSTALLLQRRAQALGWPIAATVSTARAVTGAVETGRRAILELPGRSQPVDAVEIVHLAK
jgi:DNA-binding response OmpR family regulator